jgi:putrescine importer
MEDNMSTTSAVDVLAGHEDNRQVGAQDLKRNAVGLLGATMLGVVIMGPGLAVLFTWGFLIPTVGTTTAIMFVIAMGLTLPTAYSYALINRRMPSAGATYKWASRLISPGVGITMGLCTTLFYAFIVVFTFPLQAQFFTDLIGTTSPTVFGLVTFGSFLLIIPFVYRGVTFSIDTAIVLAALEVTIVVVVAVAAFVTSDSSQASLAPLDPSKLPSLGTLMPALVLAFLAYTGYDAISTLAEETKAPRRLIPKATILSVVTVGSFWVLMALILSNALPPHVYTAAIDKGGFPLGAAAKSAFGDGGRIVTDIMGLEATFALALAAMIGTTRIPYRMGRDGVISGRFGTVHPRFKTPWFSISAAVVFVALAIGLLAIYLSMSFDITLWCVNAVAFFSLTTYLMINILNPLLHVRHFRSEFHWFSNGVVPLVGTAAVGWFFYKGFFQALWNVHGKLGRSVVWICLALLAAAAIAAWASARRPGIGDAARAPGPDEPACVDEQVLERAAGNIG